MGGTKWHAVTALWVLVWLLILTGLSVAVLTSLREPNPEIVVETCSLLAALLLVIVERLSNRAAARRALLDGVVEEMATNAAKLRQGIWRKDESRLQVEAADTKSGLRFFYPRLSTAAISAAVFSTHFDVKDFDLIRQLQLWQAAADECNERLSMAQLLLFRLPPDGEGMQERLSLHLSIRAVPVVRAKEALLEVIRCLRKFQASLPVSRDGRGVLLEIESVLQAEIEGEPGTESKTPSTA